MTTTDKLLELHKLLTEQNYGLALVKVEDWMTEESVRLMIDFNGKQSE